MELSHHAGQQAPSPTEPSVTSSTNTFRDSLSPVAPSQHSACTRHLDSVEAKPWRGTAPQERQPGPVEADAEAGALRPVHGVRLFRGL